jgi:hypothetical protein
VGVWQNPRNVVLERGGAMNTSVGDKAARMSLCLAAAVFSGMILFGCGNRVKQPTDPDPTPTGEKALVLPSGQAWTFDDGAGYINGVVFTSDWRVFAISRAYKETVWNYLEGTYTIGGNTLTITSKLESLNGTWTLVEFSNDGNTLTVSPGKGVGYSGKPVTLTKTLGVNFVPPPPANSGTGGSLVLGSGQAWVLSATDGSSAGIIFRSDNTLSIIFGYNGVWELAYDGTYTTNGSNITVASGGQLVSGSYTVSGNTLVIKIDGSTTVYTKTSNIVVSTPTGGNLILPSGQAWTNDAKTIEIGIIFQTNNRVQLLQNIDGRWEIYTEGTYTTKGNIVSVNTPRKLFTTPYSVSGNTLTIAIDGETAVFTKKSITNTSIDPPAPGGGNLVLSSGEAWIYGTSGIIFKTDNSVQLLQNIDGSWVIYSEGTYAASGGIVSVNTPQESFTGSYSVSGNTLTVTRNGETVVFTKKSGINISTAPPAPGGGNLILSSGQAWTNGNGSPNPAEGYIFKSNNEVLYIYGSSGDWYIVQEGTYQTDGAYITILWKKWGLYDGTYSISGNALTLTLGGNNFVFTKTSGIYPEYDLNY